MSTIDAAELARLRALLAALHDAAPGTGGYFAALTEVELAAVNALPALLDAAEAREGLVFVRLQHRKIGTWRALAADGVLYDIRKVDAATYEWNVEGPQGDIRRAGSFVEATKAARAHDRARRGSK